MRRIITICLLVAMVTVAFPMPEAKAIDPVTLAILAPIAIKAGLGYLCFGSMKDGLVYVIKGGIAPA